MQRTHLVRRRGMVAERQLQCEPGHQEVHQPVRDQPEPHQPLEPDTVGCLTHLLRSRRESHWSTFAPVASIRTLKKCCLDASRVCPPPNLGSPLVRNVFAVANEESYVDASTVIWSIIAIAAILVVIGI